MANQITHRARQQEEDAEHVVREREEDRKRRYEQAEHDRAGPGNRSCKLAECSSYCSGGIWLVFHRRPQFSQTHCARS